MKIRALKVGELAEYISRSLKTDQILQNIHIEGELSNLKIHSTGNIYFTIKDEMTKVQCIMFQDSYEDLEDIKLLKDGDEILCKGNVSYYKKEGTVSIIASSISRLGESQAYRKFLEMKFRLEKEGLFDQQRKKSIPLFPKKIGIITSITGAVIQDIYNVVKRRYPAVNLIVYPATVQGENALAELIKGLNTLDNQVDTIILARGGGSYEELEVFNSQELAYAIYRSQTPIISAVGHETDFTISDLVADMRASTPSVAAELAVPVLSEVIQQINQRQKNLLHLMERTVKNSNQKLQSKRNSLELLSPQKKIELLMSRVKEKKTRIEASFTQLLANKKELLNQRVLALQPIKPNQILEMGGAYLHGMDGNKIQSIRQVNDNMDIVVTLVDGQFIVKVMEKL